MKWLQKLLLSGVFIVSTAVIVQANEWIPVTGADILKEFMGGMKAERTLVNGEISRGEYFEDGTGTLFAWNASISRTWKIEGDDRICISAERKVNCYRLERNSDNPNLYRTLDVETGDIAEFEVTNGKAIIKAEAKDPGSGGGAAAPSTDELAAELSNPNTSVASLTIKNQFRWFEGDLPDADDQSSYTLLFQPALPFVLDSGDKIIWRPAVPLLVEQPVFDAETADFEGETGFGDIVMDLAYAPKRDDKLLIAFGLITSIPTATNDLGTDRWTLGPEMLIAQSYSKGLYGVFPNHQWDVAGSGDTEINLTTIQPLFVYLPGGGWNVGSAPSITYDWQAEQDQWTVPLQVNVGKTVVWSGRPWKLSVEVNYYVEKAETFGPEWMVGLNVAPVVKNGLASLFGLNRK
ncbi:MAG: hypothetical protein DRH90_20390 [Deltaproteobacteria bacterium]|nr:MAG: hypothetical protein DRH90_20390 [Deltaproteobacteria bacterium]RLC11570.1 MAG: hypothetical protein DRI24_18605 [Deltaproteobacteria bacterium]